MKILIAGGTGLIGRVLTKRLVETNHKVTILSRSAQPGGLPPSVGVSVWDGQNRGAWHADVESADAIINLAGENIGDLPWTNARKVSIRSSRVDAGHALVEAIRDARHKPAVLLQASAVGYYGTHPDEIFTEDSPPGLDFLSEVGVDWETSTQAVEALGVRRVLLRTGTVLSPDGGVLPKFMYPVRLMVGGAMGSGRQWVSWIHMQDEVEAIRFLLENPAAVGAFNLVAPQPVANAEFVRTLAEVLCKPYWLTVPAFALQVLLGEMSMLVLDGQHVVPQRLQQMGFQFAYNDLHDALKNLSQ